MKVFLFLVLAGTALAQIEQPRIGVMLDADGNARVVYGADASVTVSEPVWKGVLSLACSSELCVAKTQAALVSTSGDVIEAPEGHAILTLDGAAVFAYFPGIRQLFRWHEGVLERVSTDDQQFAWRGSEDAVLLSNGTALFALDTFVRLVRADGTELTFPISGVTALLRMSDGYVQLMTRSGMWALRTEPGHEQLFLLPGVSQE